MKGHANRSPSLRAGIMTGAVLDAAALVAFYALLATAGQLAVGLGEWLIALVLIATPWCVHVVALPTVLRGSSLDWEQAASLFGRGLAFITVAGVVFPLMGFVCLGIVGITLRVVMGAAWTGINLTGWYDQAVGCVVILAMTALVGAAVGALLHGLRPTGTGVPSDTGGSPRIVQATTLRTDALGGASAPVLAMGGYWVAALLSHPVIVSYYQEPSFWHVTRPQVLPLVVIGFIALLPHLIMTRADPR
jgi:hypothetical protein